MREIMIIGLLMLGAVQVSQSLISQPQQHDEELRSAELDAKRLHSPTAMGQFLGSP
jgi:hypothetical protein